MTEWFRPADRVALRGGAAEANRTDVEMLLWFGRMNNSER